MAKKIDAEYIAESLRSAAVDITTLQHDPRNARRHKVRNVSAIKASLERYGQLRPVVLKADGVTVIAGNGTLHAARELGWKYLAVVRTTLDGDDATAYGLADNRTAELAEWDHDRLAELIGELDEADYGIGDMGWTDDEIAKLVDDAPPDVPDGEPEPSAAPAAAPSFAEDLPGYGRPLTLTSEQREVVDRVVARIRKAENEDLAEGRCIELALADWEAGQPK